MTSTEKLGIMVCGHGSRNSKRHEGICQGL